MRAIGGGMHGLAHGRMFGLAMAMALGAGGAWAASASEPMALRGVMQQMEHDTLAANAALRQQDWAELATRADRLAPHAEPPITEKVRILGWLLTDAPTFRNHDVQVKAAATELQAAAQKKDAAAATSALQRMQQSCDGCHNSFRDRYLKRFYDKP